MEEEAAVGAEAEAAEVEVEVEAGGGPGAPALLLGGLRLRVYCAFERVQVALVESPFRRACNVLLLGATGGLTLEAAQRRELLALDVVAASLCRAVDAGEARTPPVNAPGTPPGTPPAPPEEDSEDEEQGAEGAAGGWADPHPHPHPTPPPPAAPSESSSAEDSEDEEPAPPSSRRRRAAPGDPPLTPFEDPPAPGDVDRSWRNASITPVGAAPILSPCALHLLFAGEAAAPPGGEGAPGLDRRRGLLPNSEPT